MVKETLLFFREGLQNDLSLASFVHSDFTMLNGRLARHYGIPDVNGVAFRKVALKPEWHRGGVLTHASVLKVTANGTTTVTVTANSHGCVTGDFVTFSGATGTYASTWNQEYQITYIDANSTS